MESKKNKTSPKTTKKKTSSSIDERPPIKINQELKSPPDPNNIIISNTKEEKDEKNLEKKEEKPDNKKRLEEIMEFEFEDGENFNPLYLNEFMPFYRPLKEESDKSPSERIITSLKKMETGDDMDIMNELLNLREFLSMSSERIGYNPNMSKLLEEICKNLTKTYLPEMIIYCLQCINYIIDINPSLATILKKINAIESIMNTITAVEDISCLEHIIKIFDKISMQNSRILLENKIFESFLVNIFDFLNIHQKKSIMKICYNITNRIFTIKDYNLYIKPAMNVLINLGSFDESNERENLFIVESSTNIFYNIIHHLKDEIIFGTKEKIENPEIKEQKEENNDNNNSNIIDEIIKNYKVIENYKLILDKFFLKNSKIISQQLIQSILKTIALILEISKEGIDKILSNKFLEIISEVIKIEFVSDIKENNNNNNLNNNIINIIPIRSNSNINNIPYKKFSLFSSEFFGILNSFFPSSTNSYYKGNPVDNKKLLKPENKTYYDYFCQNIFLPLINNVMKKSMNIIQSNNFIKLISSFINNASKDYIILFLPPKPISQIIIKLLNTRKYSAVNDSIFLIKTLLDKSPENFIVSFVREGIIDNLKNFKPLEEDKIELRRGRLNLPKYGLSLFTEDLKRLKRKRKKHLRRKQMNYQIQEEKDKDNDNINQTEKEKDNNYNENKENKEKEIPIEKEKEKENDNKIKIIEEEKIKEIKENNSGIKLDEDKEEKDDKEEKEDKDEEDNEQSEKENPEEDEENEDNEGNEDNEDNEDNDDDNNEDKEENDNNENEEKEQEEDEDQENSDKNGEEIEEEIEEENENENQNDKINEKEENNLINKDLIDINKSINIPPIPIKDNNEIKEEKDKEKDKEKEKEKDKDKEESNNNNKIEILEKKVLSLKEILNNNILKINDEINKEKKSLKDTILLSRKRKYESEEYLLKKVKRNLDQIKVSDNKIIQDKIKDLLENYLTEEKIQQFLALDENKEKIKLIKIKETLSSYNKEIFSLTTSSKAKENYIKNALDILIDEKISITLYELQKSQILLSLCHFFGAEFFSIYNQLKDDNTYKNIDELVLDLKQRNIIPEKKEINYDIFNKVFKFINYFEGDKQKIIKFISLLNESILGMNNSILNLYDRKTGLMLSMPEMANVKIKINYNENIFKEKVLKDNFINDESFKTKLCELNMFFFTNKRLIISVNDNSSFKLLGIILLSTANIPLISNDKYDIYFEFYVEVKIEKKEEKEKIEEKNNKEQMIIEKEKEKEKENENNMDEEEIDVFEENDEIMEEEDFFIPNEKENVTEKIEKKDNNNDDNNNNNKQEINMHNNNIIKEIKVEKKYITETYQINENTTYKEFIKDFSSKYKDIIPNIQFGLSLKPKNNDLLDLNKNSQNDNKIIIQIEKDIPEEETKGSSFKEYYIPYINNIPTKKDFINFNEYSFIKEYHENILYNKHIYISKSFSPSIYLLSLLNLSILKYPKLFNFQKNTKEFKKLFYNMKFDSYVFKLSSYPRKILNGPISFMSNFISNNNSNHQLLKFQTRLLNFKTSFEPAYKSMINLQNFIKHNGSEFIPRYNITLKKTYRLKINVEREKIIEHAFNIINDSNFSNFIGYLEFEYKNEIGNGLGPTLEFYTLISDKIKADENLWYKTTDGSLYPKLLDIQNGIKNIYNKKMFKLLGYIVGRAIFDDRLLDIPLSKVFWDRILNRGINFESLKDIDINLYNTIQDFIILIKQKNDYIKQNNISTNNINEINFDDIILYNKCKLSELDIYFTFPGYDINLKPDGENILLTMNNIEEYINLIYDFIFFKCVNEQINSFKEGFNMNFDINKMQCFSSEEIEENICGSKEIKWEQNNLYENLNPEHGYTKQSKIFNDLIKFMCSLNDSQKKKFLIFSTGSSRLPIGGFKSLSPKLTVVKKFCEEGSNPNDFLPTVMTCQNYLKIPEYSRYDILEKKILMAMEEGCNEFSLS